jgi:peptidoglycan/LPS O-acetylase OafA/YrhL
MLILGVILFYLYIVNNIYYLPFVCGICIAIFHHKPNEKVAKYVAFLSPLILGLVVYYSCSTMRGGILGLPAMPRTDILNILAASALVFVASCTPAVRSFFQNRLSKYLGSISFPLYLTHFLVICSFSSYLLLELQKFGFSPERSNVINCVVSFVVCIVVAHLFRYVENFAIRTARKFSHLLMCEA